MFPSKKLSNEPLQTPKGTRDILPAEFPYWEHVIRTGEEIAQFYGFGRITPPHIEKTDLFLRTLGRTTDIVEKQMYSFRTRGGDRLTLRPEFTAPIARAYIEHGMHSLPQPVRLYSYGACFRHEHPQRGRYREFNQFNFEILGEDDPVTDALIIRLLYLFLDELGFKNIAVQVNSVGDEESRAVYRKELVAFYRKKINSLCKDCKRRLKENPLRLLDCKEEGCREVREEAPQMLKYLTDNSKKRFKVLLEFLDEGAIPYFLDPYLVRGLDYYAETVFEMFVNCVDGPAADISPEGTAPPLALGGGGRYDGLLTMLGGKPTPAMGSALGLDRVVQEMKDAAMPLPKERTPRVFLVQLGPAAKKKSFSLMEQFRKAGINIAESLGKDSIKSQLKAAEKMDATYSLLIGQREALDDTAIIRAMDTGAQETVRMDSVIEELKKKLKKR